MTSKEASGADSATVKRTPWLVLGGCIVALICVGCLAVTGAFAYFFWLQETTSTAAGGDPSPTPSPTPSPGHFPTTTAPETNSSEATPDVVTPAPNDSSSILAMPLLNITPPADIVQDQASPQTEETLTRLMEAAYPHQDYFETAVRLGGSKLGPRTIESAPYLLNDRRTFYTDQGNVDATLAALTDHTYFWVQEGLNLNQSELQNAADRLENDYYPRIVNLFGQEWLPGVDNDPHFSVLHLEGSSDSYELGYFINVDEYPRALFPESNEQELIYLNMAQLELGSDLYYGTLVHELQHLIQWYVDPNETTWLNEGLSQLAEIYAGLETVDPYEYHLRPEIRLNAWDRDEQVWDAHYAASYLFSVYLWEQLGESAIQELSRHPANGLAAVRSVLRGYRPDMSFEQLFADWIAANFLDNPAAGPRFYYQNLDLDRPTYEMRITELPMDLLRDLNQFGAHFIELSFRGEATLTFAADTVANLIDAPPPDQGMMWYAPGVDDANAKLTAAFDLTGIDRATLRFGAWFDLEENFDFAYVSVSSDGGQTWQILRPDHSTRGEFGPSFNGRSDQQQGIQSTADGWIKESISLDEYVDGPLLIRFEVLTDYETDHLGTGRGFAVDDISIPEIGYYTDVEGGADGWIADGFVQSGWQLPQRWALVLIEDGPIPQVTQLQLNEQNQGQWPITVGKGGGILAIIPLTPFVDEPATYWLQIAN